MCARHDRVRRRQRGQRGVVVGARRRRADPRSGLRGIERRARQPHARTGRAVGAPRRTRQRARARLVPERDDGRAHVRRRTRRTMAAAADTHGAGRQRGRTRRRIALPRERGELVRDRTSVVRRRRLDSDLTAPRRDRGRIVLAYAVLAIAVALTTVYVSHHALPHGTTDLDEVAYQAQANTIRTGHFSLARATFDPAFRPFLSGLHGSHVVFKYQPVWPALVAASDAVFGSSMALRILMAFGVVMSVAWFAWELFREARVALLAAALVAISPFLWVQSATLLGYSLSFVLGVS